jgi:hypothetical protein
MHTALTRNTENRRPEDDAMMRVKIDFEVSPRWTRALRFGIPVAVFLAAGVAYAALPHTFTPGETLTSANLNASFQSLDGRVTQLEVPRVFAVDLVSVSGDIWSVANQVPAGWVTVANGTPTSQAITCSNGAAGVFLQNTLTLNFATSFTSAPICTGVGAPGVYPAISRNSIAFTAHDSCADANGGHIQIVCVAP